MFVDFTLELFDKEPVLTEAVNVEGTEIADDETAEEAHVVAAETDCIAFLHSAHFQVIFELFGILLS